MIEFVKAFITHFTYLALIAVLAATGMGVPVPEDVPLIFSGYLCHEHESPITLIDTNGDGIPDTATTAPQPPRVPNLYLMIASGMIGVILGDSVVFFIGRRGIDSNNLVARHIRKVMHSRRRERVEKHFYTHGNLTVFAGRFLPLFRSVVFAMAGMSRMSYLKFIVIDGLAAAISVPIFILLGYHFASNINTLFHAIDHAKAVILPIVALAAILGILFYIRHRQRLHALAALAPPPSPRDPVTADKVA